MKQDESYSLEAGVVGQCVELDFEGPVTKVTFEVPHGSAFVAGKYLIAPLVPQNRTRDPS